MPNEFYRNIEEYERKTFPNIVTIITELKEEQVMNTFYQVTTQYTSENDKGKVTKVTERYLVNAVSVTDAEAIATKEWGTIVSEFEVKEVKKSRIVDVFI